MYEIYKEESPNPVNSFIFRKIFNERFNLHFHQRITDSCKKCDLFDVHIQTSSDPALVQQLKTERELHQRKALNTRNGLREDTEFAKQDEIAVICFDLMKPLPTPVLITGICYYKRQLWTYWFSVHDMKTGKSFMFLWNETIASRGSQEVGSCLLHYIKNFVPAKKIIMYSDQCGGQNRNKISALCNYIVTSSDFTIEEIDHKFLVSGHSFLPCDQDFGLIEKQNKFHPHIYVPSN